MNADQIPGLLYGDVSERIIKGFYEVYNELGYGFLESVYEKALCDVLEHQGLHFECQALVKVNFRGKVIADFRLDLVVERVVIVEVKAASALTAAHEAQIINYLKATGLPVGLLLNFGPRAQFRRRVFDSSRLNPRSST